MLFAPPIVVGLRVALDEVKLQRLIKQAGGKWDLIVVWAMSVRKLAYYLAHIFKRLVFNSLDAAVL